MAKFYGRIGFVGATMETAPGVWEDVEQERPYYGDFLRNSRLWQAGEDLNDNLNVNNSISIVADAFAHENMQAMRYVEWNGPKWKITSVTIERPRIVLQVGGIYNG